MIYFIFYRVLDFLFEYAKIVWLWKIFNNYSYKLSINLNPQYYQSIKIWIYNHKFSTVFSHLNPKQFILTYLLKMEWTYKQTYIIKMQPHIFKVLLWFSSKLHGFKYIIYHRYVVCWIYIIYSFLYLWYIDF